MGVSQHRGTPKWLDVPVPSQKTEKTTNIIRQRELDRDPTWISALKGRPNGTGTQNGVQLAGGCLEARRKQQVPGFSKFQLYSGRVPPFVGNWGIESLNHSRVSERRCQWISSIHSHGQTSEK